MNAPTTMTATERELLDLLRAERARSAALTEKVEALLEGDHEAQLQCRALQVELSNTRLRLKSLELSNPADVDQHFANERRRHIEIMGNAFAEIERLTMELAHERLELQRLRGLLGGLA